MFVFHLQKYSGSKIEMHTNFPDFCVLYRIIRGEKNLDVNLAIKFLKMNKIQQNLLQYDIPEEPEVKEEESQLDTDTIVIGE